MDGFRISLRKPSSCNVVPSSLLVPSHWPAAALLAPFAAQAQAFPSRPVKLVIAFPAGGLTDITMRQLAENASKILGQPVIVDSNPALAARCPRRHLQGAPGRRLRVAQIPLGVFRLGYTTKINWDPIKDISYVINVTGYAFGIVVPGRQPPQDLEGLRRLRQGQLSEAELRLGRHADQPAP